MFDSHDETFQKTSATPRLGPPALTASGTMTFIGPDRFPFDRHNAEFRATSAEPRLLPPVGRGRHIIIRKACHASSVNSICAAQHASGRGQSRFSI
jgi:hypothetical protein